MRKIIYILLAYFSFLNLIGVTGAHVHHDTVSNPVHYSELCDAGNAEEAGSAEKEDFIGHIYENGCIRSSGFPQVKPVPVWVAVEFENSQIVMTVYSRNAAPSFPESVARHSSPCAVTFRLRAPPSIS